MCENRKTELLFPLRPMYETSIDGNLSVSVSLYQVFFFYRISGPFEALFHIDFLQFESCKSITFHSCCFISSCFRHFPNFITLFLLLPYYFLPETLEYLPRFPILPAW